MKQVVIVGGGAAGFFAAITCAEANPDCRVTILERGNSVLQKVRISGGGRCNVTHHCFDARALTQFYPRGSRELLGPFMRFGPQQTIDWFDARGVTLKTEADGRMFPDTDTSQTIVSCLWNAARDAGVDVRTGARVEQILPEQQGFRLKIARETDLVADTLMIAAGSSEAVWEMLAGIGHTIVPPVPSLFTFNIKDTRIKDLAGVSVPKATVSVPGSKLQTEGPLLITHWGMSGPAILRLSAWGARWLHEKSYHFDLIVNWLYDQTADAVLDEFNQQKQNNGKKQISANALFGLPTRLWQQLCLAAAIPPAHRWADLDKKSAQALARELVSGSFQVRGKSTFKEEFVTAGGVDLKEINFKTFQSKLHPGLFMAGEVLDIDAITGGFNFQAAWTGGFIAGTAMATGQ